MSFLNKYFYYLLLLNIILLIHSKILRHSDDIFSNHKTFIESHRGVNREIFQNTLKAFERAIQYDVESFETDVWLTKDNVLVILHGGDGGNLEGYYDHEGLVTDYTWEELSNFRTIEDNLPMPRLIDVLELTKNKIFMNLEIKDPRADLVFPYIVQLLEEYDYFDQIAISSFHHEYYDKILEYNNAHMNKLIFGFLYHKNNKSELDYTKGGHTLNVYWNDISKELCDKAHENGMAVLAWFSMDDEENTEIYRNLINIGVDCIICNEPLLARKFRDNYYFK